MESEVQPTMTRAQPSGQGPSQGYAQYAEAMQPRPPTRGYGQPSQYTQRTVYEQRPQQDRVVYEEVPQQERVIYEERAQQERVVYEERPRQERVVYGAGPEYVPSGQRAVYGAPPPQYEQHTVINQQYGPPPAYGPYGYGPGMQYAPQQPPVIINETNVIEEGPGYGYGQGGMGGGFGGGSGMTNMEAGLVGGGAGFLGGLLVGDILDN